MKPHAQRLLDAARVPVSTADILLAVIGLLCIATLLAALVQSLVGVAVGSVASIVILTIALFVHPRKW